MKKALIVLAVIVLSVVSVVAVPFVAPIFLLQTVLNFKCPDEEKSPRCMKGYVLVANMLSEDGDDLEEAAEWYGRAAKFGDKVAMFHLAWAHQALALEETKETIKRLVWDMKNFAVLVADLTDASGSSSSPGHGGQGSSETGSIGKKLVNHFSSAGKSAHWVIAREWYKKSSDAGFAPATNNLGQLYLKGLGGPKDEANAYRLHLAAADAGNPVAAWNVAAAYSFGKGVVPDKALAEKWSVWIPNPGIADELREPVLKRTFMSGQALPGYLRAAIRDAVKEGKPVTISFRPLTPNPRLPTFNDIKRR